MDIHIKEHTKMAKRRKTTDAVKILHKRYIRDSEDKKMLQEAREQYESAKSLDDALFGEVSSG